MNNILVVNDDGITAPGIKALVEVASELGNVTIVAPDSPQSGMGHAITIAKPLWLRRSRMFPDYEAYECSGTPVDCVKLAKQILYKDKPLNLVVSGINHGSNAAVNIIYSGTMSAAMEGSLEGYTSLGFSLLDYRYEADFEPAKPFIKSLIEKALRTESWKGALFNINIPSLPEGQIKGIKYCRQSEARWVEHFEENKDPRGRSYYWLAGEFVNEDNREDTDVAALEAGYISVVPSMHDLTDYDLLQKIHADGLSK